MDRPGAGPTRRRTYEALLAPAALTPGDYDVRAVATDDAGLADPAPASVGVTLGDTTPPATPADLAALVDGASVQVSWTANGEGDLAGYHVDRDGARLTGAALATPDFRRLGEGRRLLRIRGGRRRR